MRRNQRAPLLEFWDRLKRELGADIVAEVDPFIGMRTLPNGTRYFDGMILTPDWQRYVCGYTLDELADDIIATIDADTAGDPEKEWELDIARKRRY